MAYYSLLNVPGIERLSPWFRWRLASWAASAGVSADCILAMMHIESGMKADAVNPKTGASGLIQVIPKMAYIWDVTIDEVRTMSAEEQLERIIIKKPWPKTLDCGTVYMANFLPAYAYAPDSQVLGEKDSKEQLKGGLTTGAVYAGNYGFDADKDGIFTVGDVKNFLRGKVSAWAEKRGYLEIPFEEPERPAGASQAGSGSGSILLGLGILGLGVAIAKRVSR